MTRERFDRWLRSWLAEHPPKAPPADAQGYVDEVMARVRRIDRPAPVPAPAWAIPRWAWAAALATSCFVIGIGLWQRSAGDRFASERPSPSPVITEEPVTEEPGGESQPVVLAEDHLDDDAWLDDTIELLDDLDALEHEDDPSVEDWTEELRALDAAELASAT